jgi:hypothetical protein
MERVMTFFNVKKQIYYKIFKKSNKKTTLPTRLGSGLPEPAL